MRRDFGFDELTQAQLEEENKRDPPPANATAGLISRVSIPPCARIPQPGDIVQSIFAESIEFVITGQRGCQPNAT